MTTGRLLDSIAPSMRSAEVKTETKPLDKHSYYFSIKCKKNENVTKWVTTHLGEETNLDLNKELETGLHLTLLFVGDMHSIYTEKATQLNKDVEELLSKYDMETPLVLEEKSIVKMGFNKNILAIALQQKNDVFKEISKALRQLLTNKYGIKVIGADFKAHVTVGYSKDGNKEIPDQLIVKLNENFHKISNEIIQPDISKMELNHKVGDGIVGKTARLETPIQYRILAKNTVTHIETEAHTCTFAM